MCIRVVFFLFLLAGVVRGEEPDALRVAAREGDIEAQLKLANHFFFGEQERLRNPVLAAYWYRRAAEQGSPLGLYNLGACLEHGWGVKKSLVLAYDAYAKAGVVLPEARLRQALLLYRGIPSEELPVGERSGVDANPTEALQMLRKLAVSLNQARAELARILLASNELRIRNADEIRTLAEKAVDGERSPENLLLLAGLCRDGIGKVGEPKRAVALLEEASSAGSAEAKAQLAELYDSGYGCVLDRKKAFALTAEAAAGGSPRAQMRMGEAVLAGEFVEHDPIRAREWFLAAEEGGYPPALVKLGECSELGVGTSRDPRRAFEYYARAARAGVPEGARKLAYCYEKGIGIAPDPGAAEFWKKRAR